MLSLNVTVPADLECLWLIIHPSYVLREVSRLVAVAVYDPPKATNEQKLIDHTAQTTETIKTE